MYPSNGIQDTSLFRFPDNIFPNPSSTNQEFSSSSMLNVFPSQLIGFNDEPMFLQDFYDNLHEGATNTNMIKVADDIYSNKYCNVNKRKISSGGSRNVCEQIRINRRCKKDRHSKITTANGSLRGRRMRLSLKVAEKFFSLQDLLGLDTASKTVEWLLKRCENAIKEVTTKRAFGMKHNPCPSTSVLSATDELEPVATTKEKTKAGTQKVNASHLLKSRLREKARARARKRTQDKKRLQLDGGFTDHNDRSRLYNCSQRMNVGGHYPLLNCEKSAAAGNTAVNMSTIDPAPILGVKDLLNYSKQQPDSFEGSTNTEEHMTDHSFFISNNWNPYTIFNFHHNPGTISYELQHQFTSFLQYD